MVRNFRSVFGKRIIWNFFFVLLFAGARAISAQQFTAQVDQNPVAVGQPFSVTFTLSGGNLNDISAFHPPDFKNFSVLSGPNQSTNVQIINGVYSSQRGFSYYLSAAQKGKFVINSAEITSGGKTLRTQPITIEVIVGASNPSAQNQGKDQNTGNEPDFSQHVFIRATADKATAYIGEQVTVTYKLYTRLELRNLQIGKLPTYTGFWAEELTTSNQLSFTSEIVNGKEYRVAVLKRAALFPSQSGNLTVTPFDLKIAAVVPQKKKQSRGFFDDFFDDPFFKQMEVVEKEIHSNGISVKALLPPEANKPASYDGAVGSYIFNVSADKQKVKQNEPVTLKITISGQGNLPLLTAPKLILPDVFDQYDSKSDEAIAREQIIGGRKTFEYIVIPRAEGNLEIPSFEFSYFNPQKRSYSTINSNAIPIKVEGMAADYSNNRSMPKESADNDIRFISAGSQLLHPRGDSPLDHTGFWAGVITPIVLAGLILIGTKRYRMQYADMDQLRLRRAERFAMKRLRSAARARQKNNPELFYKEMFTGVYEYARNKFVIPQAELSYETITAAMEKANYSEGSIIAFKALIENCEFARYASAGMQAGNMENIYNEAVRLIVMMEQEYSSRGRNK